MAWSVSLNDTIGPSKHWGSHPTPDEGVRCVLIGCGLPNSIRFSPFLSSSDPTGGGRARKAATEVSEDTVIQCCSDTEWFRPQRVAVCYLRSAMIPKG